MNFQYILWNSLLIFSLHEHLCARAQQNKTQVEKGKPLTTLRLSGKEISQSILKDNKAQPGQFPDGQTKKPKQRRGTTKKPKQKNRNQIPKKQKPLVKPKQIRKPKPKKIPPDQSDNFPPRRSPLITKKPKRSTEFPGLPMNDPPTRKPRPKTTKKPKSTTESFDDVITDPPTRKPRPKTTKKPKSTTESFDDVITDPPTRKPQPKTTKKPKSTTERYDQDKVTDFPTPRPAPKTTTERHDQDKITDFPTPRPAPKTTTERHNQDKITDFPTPRPEPKTTTESPDGNEVDYDDEDYSDGEDQDYEFVPGLGCLFGEKRCKVQCNGRGFPRSVCRSYKCSCLKDSVKSLNNLRLCAAMCPRVCRQQSKAMQGLCDSTETCYCYQKDARVDLNNGQCYVPKIVCGEQCTVDGFSMYTCLDEICVCADPRSKYKALNYKTTECVVPKPYCKKRCKGAKFPKGVCYHDRCICMMLGDPDKDFIVIDIGKDDAVCDKCKMKCQEKASSGRCIAGECVCINGNDFQVMGKHLTGPVCELPKDYCQFVCANSNYFRRVECSGSICKCHIGPNSEIFDFQGQREALRQQCQQYCYEKHYRNGLSNGSNCLCVEPVEENLLMAFDESEFACEKYPMTPFTSVCVAQ